MKLKTNITIAVAGTSALLASCSVFAATVYNVPRSNDAVLYSDPREYGDQITLGGLPAERQITSFSVEYSANYNFAGGATVRFYENDGIGGQPLSNFFDSGPLDIKIGGGIYKISFSRPIVPDTFTYTVQFLNVGGANQAGLALPNASATIGSSLDDFWIKTGTTWQLNNFGATKANFTASVTAVPEPGTYALAGVAGFAWLAFAGCRRFRK